MRARSASFLRTRSVVFFLFFTILPVLQAMEITDGNIRLRINERNGSFSICILANPAANDYVSLLNPRDSRTSYLSVKVNNRVYRPGRSPAFNTRLDYINNNPAIIYESAFLLVSKVFTPVRTANSPVSNGIEISINIENKTPDEMSLGLRFLIDSYLGERCRVHSGRIIPFITDTHQITRETIVESSSGQTYWISRNADVSLMGNIVNIFDDGSRAPDFLHFANWKKLNDTPWYARYRPGRLFNHLPYSVRDSAVCYFWEPQSLSAGQLFSYSVFLATEDTAWFNLLMPELPTISVTEIEAAVIESAVGNLEESRLLILHIYYDLLRKFINGEIVLTEQDLLEIERAINRLEDSHRMLP